MADGRTRAERCLYRGCTFASRRDLFNLGDKLLFDLAAVFIFPLLMCRRDGFSHWLAVFAEPGRVFLSEKHVIVLPSTCVLVWKIKECACV